MKQGGYPNKVFSLLACGFSRSGKTHRIKQMLKMPQFRSMFALGTDNPRTYVICPTIDYDDSLVKEPQLNKFNVWNHCNEGVLAQIIGHVRKTFVPGEDNDSLLILDDCMSDLSTKRRSQLLMALTILRHVRKI